MYALGILAVQRFITLIPVGILLVCLPKRVDIVRQRARGPADVLRYEIVFQVGKSAHQDQTRERIETAYESDHGYEDDQEHFIA